MLRQDSGDAISLVDITFDITETVPFEVSFIFFSGPPYASFLFEGPSGVILRSQHPADFRRGFLDPGRYRIAADITLANFSEHDDLISGGDVLEFALVVPEPGTLGLLLGGLLVLSGRRTPRRG